MLYKFSTRIAKISRTFSIIIKKCYARSIPEIIGVMIWVSDELELLGEPGYELAKKNLDLMDSLMNEVHWFYENWERKLNEITDKHEEEQRLHATQKK